MRSYLMVKFPTFRSTSREGNPDYFGITKQLCRVADNRLHSWWQFMSSSMIQISCENLVTKRTRNTQNSEKSISTVNFLIHIVKKVWF